MSEQELGPGSEGDAYRYTKKVLLSLPNVAELRRIYTEIADNRNISSWTRACYEELRRQFFRDGQCKIKFAPGLARIAYGELLFGTGDEDFRQMADLRDFVRIISIAHFTEFTRHLAIDGQQLTFKDLVERFGSTVSGNWKELKRELNKIKYGPRRYKVIWLDSFATANQYYKYTQPHNWCHLGSPHMFKSYSYNAKRDEQGNRRLSVVKLYLAVLPGFETMTEDDPLYGESMLGIDIGPDGRLMHVNNRWNHSHDNIDERKGDNKYSERELSELMGGPFYKLCPPFSKRDYKHIESILKRARQKENKVCLGWAKQLSRKLSSAINMKCGVREHKFVDERDGREYRTGIIGNREWMLDPLAHIGIRDVRESQVIDANRKALEHDWYCYDDLHCKKGLPYESGSSLKVAVTGGHVVNQFNPYAAEDEENVVVLHTGEIQDEECIPDPECINHFVPLTSLDFDRNGHAKVYMSSDICKLSDSSEYDSMTYGKYNDDCDEYRKWRAEHIDAGENALDKNGKYVMYSDDNYCGVFEDEYSAIEMITPLGFERTCCKTVRSNRQKYVVNDIDDARSFVFYSARAAISAIPKGWRLPTITEFMAMAMAKGARFKFDHGNIFGSKTNGEVIEREGVITKDDASPELKDRLFEELIDGNIERKFETKTTNDLLDAIRRRNENTTTVVDNEDLTPFHAAHDYAVDENVDMAEVAADDGADEQQQQVPQPDEGVGFNLDAEVPNLAIRLPTVEFPIRDAGFAFPSEYKSTARPFDFTEARPLLTRPILLAIDGTAGMNETECKKFCRKFGKNEFDKYLGDYTEEIEEALNELQEAVDRIEDAANGLPDSELPKMPYAVATWNESKHTFSITVSSKLDYGSGEYFMLYCVKDNRHELNKVEAT